MGRDRPAPYARGSAPRAHQARLELICRLTGWRCIRITWADLENPEATAAMILRELDRVEAA